MLPSFPTWYRLPILAVSLVTGLLAAGQPEAQGRNPQRAVASHDANRDGKVSRQEWRGPAARFPQIDANSDGFLTADEFARFWARAEGGSQGTTTEKAAGGAAAKTCVTEPVTRAGDYSIEHYAPACVFQGTTLFVDNADPEWSKLVEIDFQGKVVWELKVSRIVSDLGKGEYALDAERLRGGNTLFTIKGKGVYEVDRKGNLVWKHEDSGISHDADRLPNGNTLVVRGWIGKGEAHVQEIAPDGQIVWSWNGVAQFDRPPYGNVDREGWIHVNAATRMPDGSTWVSLRNFDIVARLGTDGQVLNEVKLPLPGTRIPEQIQERHRSSGELAVVMPHDPEIQPNGNLLIPHAAIAGLVVETDPAGSRQVWRKFWPRNSGVFHIRDANRLPNGNILVTSGTRLLEIDSAGEVVWQMTRAGLGDKPSNNQQLFKAQRIAPDGRAYGG